MHKWYVIVGFILFACSAEKTNNKVIIAEENAELVINEYSLKGEIANEYGDTSDWIELYNISQNKLQLKAGEWSISDNQKDKYKYILPEITIAANGHLLIWCDGLNKVEKDVHANFKLSDKDEKIGLYKNGILMDEILINREAKKKKSYGRVVDGDKEWKIFKKPTPGLSNHLPDNNTKSL